MRTNPPTHDPDEDRALLGMVLILIVATHVAAKILWGR